MTTPETCPRCGASLDPNAYGGLCPACLIGDIDPFEIETEVDAGSTEDAPSAEELNRALPEYEVTEIIGRGGMGTVYRARQFELDRDVAIKLMARHSDKKAADSFAERFAREAQVTAQLDHPAIVPVHSMGYDAEGRSFYTMRLVSGRDFASIIGLVEKGGSSWNLSRALGVLVRICQAIAYAHAKGVIHRDIKPPNIMVGDLGEVYMLDWGLAKFAGHDDLREIREEIGTHQKAGAKIKITDATSAALRTLEGSVIGTPAYMSPEQAAGKIDQVDHLADVYSLGAMLYHLLALHPPYMPAGSNSSSAKVLSDLLEHAPKKLPELRSDAPPELVAICDKAMARDRTQRYTSALALGEDIQAYLDGRVVGAYESGGIALLKKWVKRNRALAAAAALALLCLIGGLTATTIVQAKANKEIGASLVEEKAAKHVTQLTLAESYVNLALEATEDKRLGVGALWLAHAAKASQGDPELHTLNRQRFQNWHHHALRPVSAFSLGDGPLNLRFDFHPLNARWLMLNYRDGAWIRGPNIIDLDSCLALRADGQKQLPAEFRSNFSAAAWNPSALQVAFTETPGQVTIWNLAEDRAEILIEIPGEKEPITTLAWSDDGALLFICGKLGHLWDAAAGQLRDDLTFPHPHPVRAADFNPEKDLILTSMISEEDINEHHQISVFRLDQAGPLARPSFPPVPHLVRLQSPMPTFVPGTRAFYTFENYDCTIRDVENGEPLTRHHYGGIIDLSADGKAIVGASVRNFANGETFFNFKDIEGRLSPDGSELINTRDASIRHTSDGKIKRFINACNQRDTTYGGFSNDGTRLATISASEETIVKIFDTTIPSPLRFVATNSLPGDVLVSPDGRWVVGKGHHHQFFLPRDITTLQVCEIATGKLTGAELNIGAQVIDTAFNKDASLLATLASVDENSPAIIQIYDWRDGNLRRDPVTLTAPGLDIIFAPDGQSVAISCSDGSRWKLPIDGGPPQLLFSVPIVGHVARSGLEFSGTTLVTWALRHICLWDWEAGKMLIPPIHGEGLPEIAISSQGVIGINYDYLIGGERDSFLSAKDGSVIPNGMNYSYVGSAARAGFSPDGALFMISGDRDFAKAWDWRSGEPAGPELIHPNAQAAFVPDTHSVLSVDQLSEVNGRINQARLFDLPSGKLIAPPIELPGSSLWGLAVTPDGKHAIIADFGSQPGFHIIDLEKLHPKDPFANLNDDELIRYAELTVAATLEKGSPTRIEDQEWFKLWQATKNEK